MLRRTSARRRPGQAIPLIAIGLVLLIAMVGLSVDVGNRYAEQRSIIRATDAATIAGMNAVIYNRGDSEVATAIRNSFRSNRVNVGDGTGTTTPEQRQMTMKYLDLQRNELCEIGACSGGLVPQGTAYVQVKTNGIVNTFFARIVGRDDLPINATSVAQRCSPVDYVFPLAVSSGALNSSGFIPTTDGNSARWDNSGYPGLQLIKRRLFLQPSASTVLQDDAFAFLRWQGGADTLAGSWLASALDNQGTMRRGYKEVTPWPDTLSEPAKYPVKPGEISGGDWIFGYPGWPSGGGVSSSLQHMIDTQLEVILPIVSKRVALTGGNGDAYQFDRLGLFRLVSYAQTGAGGASVELVYLRDASSVACLNTSVLDLNSAVNIQGTVQVRPRWAGQPADNLPATYVVVFDQSGSTQWNFDGLGFYEGRAWQCEAPDPSKKFLINGTLQSVPDGSDSKCDNGPAGNTPWNVTSEQRSTVAKNALKTFIDGMGAQDRMRIVGFSDKYGTYTLNGANYRYAKAFPNETAVVPDANPTAPGWTGSKSTLKGIINSNAFSPQGNGYPTGGTSGADAVRLAEALLAKAPNTAPDGKSYKKVLLYITDGVANVFMSGSQPGNAFNDYRNDICRVPQGKQTANNPACQIGVLNPGGYKLPITAMIDQARLMKDKYGSKLQVFTVALGSAPGVEVGMDAIASDPSYAKSAKTPDVMDRIFGEIRQAVEGDCAPLGGTNWTDQIAGPNLPEADLANGIDPTNGVVGKVYLRPKGGGTLSPDLAEIPIKISNTGKMVFALPANAGLPPGEYLVKAFVRYRVPQDIVEGAAQYDSLLPEAGSLPTEGVEERELRIVPAVAGADTVILDTLFLDLKRTVNLCTRK